MPRLYKNGNAPITETKEYLAKYIMSGAAALSAARNRRSNPTGPTVPVAKKNIPGQASCSVRQPPARTQTPAARQQLQQQQQQAQQQQAQQQQAQQQQSQQQQAQQQQTQQHQQQSQQQQAQQQINIPMLHPIQILKVHDVRLNKLEQQGLSTAESGDISALTTLLDTVVQTQEAHAHTLGTHIQSAAAQGQALAAATVKITALEKSEKTLTAELSRLSSLIALVETKLKLFQDSFSVEAVPNEDEPNEDEPHDPSVVSQGC